MRLFRTDEVIQTLYYGEEGGFRQEEILLVEITVFRHLRDSVLSVPVTRDYPHSV